MSSSVLQSGNLNISIHKLQHRQGLDTNRETSGYSFQDFQEAKEQVVWRTHLQGHEELRLLTKERPKGA